MPQRDRELSRLRRLYGERRDLFEGALREAGLSFFASASTFYVWCREPRAGFVRELQERGVMGISGRGFGSGGSCWARFAVCAGRAQLVEAKKRIVGLMKSLKAK